MNEAVRFLSQVFLTSKLVLKCRMRVQEKKEKKKKLRWEDGQA